MLEVMNAKQKQKESQQKYLQSCGAMVGQIFQLKEKSR